MIARDDLILLPLLVLVVLTAAMYAAFAIAKSRALSAGRVDLARRELPDDARPECVMKINNDIRNRFELPVLS